MDLVIRTDSLPRMGETVIGKDFAMVPGGKGANQAVAAARLGAQVAMIGCVGNDLFGNKLVDTLRENHVDTRYIKRLDDVSTGIAVITVNRGDNCIILDSGANYRITPEDIEACVELIAGADVLVTQLEIPLDTVEAALKVAKQNGVQTILNPAPAQKLGDGLLGAVDVILPNESETELLTGIPLRDEDSIGRALRVFQEKGVSESIITLGSRGTAYLSGDGVQFAPSFPVKAVDTTAAGDSFVGALAVRMAQGAGIKEAVHFCNAVGALTVTRRGAQPSLPALSEVEEFLRKAGVCTSI